LLTAIARFLRCLPAKIMTILSSSRQVAVGIEAAGWQA